MALNLDDTRMNLLNPALGLVDDSDEEPWGDEDVRTAALCTAVKRIWPRMARLTREDVAIVAGAVEYDLWGIWDVEAVEVIGTSGRVLKAMRNFRNYVDHTEWDDGFGNEVAPVLRLVLPVYWPAGTTDALRVTGYSPFNCWQEGGG